MVQRNLYLVVLESKRIGYDAIVDDQDQMGFHLTLISVNTQYCSILQ